MSEDALPPIELTPPDISRWKESQTGIDWVHVLDSGLVGTAPVDRKRVEKARETIRTAARGIRARDFEPKPDYLSCSFCAFREICPSSVAR